MGFYCFSYSSKDTHGTPLHTHAYKHRYTHTNKAAIGELEIHVFVFHWGNMLQYKLTHAMWIFIIHAFVLHTANMLAGERDGMER